MAQSPKVVILGAGSLFFGRKAIWQMVHSPHLNQGTLALVDTDAERLEKMRRLAEMVRDRHNVRLAIEASTDRTKVLADADFVVLSFADRNAHFRGLDVTLSAKYGVRMCSGDTIGPGGVFRTMREYPQIIRACRDIEKLCPEAWVINYINPAAVHGIGLMRHFPGLKSFALCDAQYQLVERIARLADVPGDEKLTVRTVGPNHFTWLLRAEYDGRDLTPAVIEAMRGEAEADLNEQAQGGQAKAKGFLNNAIGVELYEAFGVLPTVVGHTKEYVRFYQGHGRVEGGSIPPLKLFESDDRVSWTQEVWRRVDDYLEGRVDLSEFDTEFGPDPATDVIETMWGGLDKRFYINTVNGGAVSNMADDAFLELYCELSMAGPEPLDHPELPRAVRAMSEVILATHELTAEGVYQRDWNLLRRALLIDPLTNAIPDTDALMAELLEAESDAIVVEEYVAALPPEKVSG